VQRMIVPVTNLMVSLSGAVDKSQNLSSLIPANLQPILADIFEESVEN
jgi:hypothetical protein